MKSRRRGAVGLSRPRRSTSQSHDESKDTSIKFLNLTVPDLFDLEEEDRERVEKYKTSISDYLIDHPIVHLDVRMMELHQSPIIYSMVSRTLCELETFVHKIDEC